MPPPKIDRQKLLTTHNLELLREDVERVFAACGWSWDSGVPRFKSIGDFRQVIAELSHVDAGSYAFRYPVNPKGKAALSSYFRFNLFEFCEVLDGLLEVLNGAAIGAYEELQAAGDAAAEIPLSDLE